ncbi:MAG: hypothetical protein AAGA70_15350 [Pseudomonadota bacterium]
MTRPTMRSVRDNIDCKALNKAGLAADQKLKRQILEREVRASGDAAISRALSEQDKFVQRVQRSAKFTIPKPRKRGPIAKDGTRRRKDYKSPEGFNECGLTSARTYASKAGARRETKKRGFPDILRHPTTIHLGPVPVDGCLEEASRSWRRVLRKVFDRFTDGVQVEGCFQIDMSTAYKVATIIPRDEWPEWFDPENRPEGVVAMFHWHADISDPYLSKDQVRERLKEAFPGPKRVCIRTVKEAWVTKDGYVTGGAQGYLEYLSMDKTKMDFEHDWQTKEAILGHARLASTWNKRNRSFSYGKSLAVSRVQIDSNRIAELERVARLEQKRRALPNLGFGERFADIWFSGMIKLVKGYAKWCSLADSVRQRTKRALALVKNWSLSSATETPCFIDHSEASLE